MTGYIAPLIIRGEIVMDADVEHGGRNPGTRFMTPDVRKHLRRLPTRPSSLADLYTVSFDEIVDYLAELGRRLAFDKNRHLQEALKLTTETSGLGPDILLNLYEGLGAVFTPDVVRTMADVNIGIPFLEGWVDIRDEGGSTSSVRAFGARSLHIVAGNVPTVSAMTIVRNAITRSDIIIKTPSNDPLTAAAIARTMIDMAPDHPITRHISVGYWKGGDTEIEDALYQPKNIEKIVAWGGMASIKHIAKYIQPGIDLITLDPKLSSTIIGAEALENDAIMAETARRVALDIGINNQQMCLNARVVYLHSGTDDEGLAKANRFGGLVYEAIQDLPLHLSNPVPSLDRELAQEMSGLKYAGDEYVTFGGDGRGAVVVSQSDEPVEFSPLLNNRVANIVPVDDLEVPVQAVTAYTQTIGVYPDSLMVELRDRLAFYGAQRLVTLGYVATKRTIAGPQDGIEPMRRMCKWILQERHDTALNPYWPQVKPQPAAEPA